MGTVFNGTTERVDERPALSIGVTGLTAVQGPSQPPRPVDFYDVKGSVEELLSRFSSRSLYFDNFAAGMHLIPMWLHPARSARIAMDGTTIGYFGQLHPEEAQRRKIKQTVFVGEIYLDRLYRQALRQPAVREISRFQAVRRDFSLTFPNAVRWAQVADALTALGIAELTSFASKRNFSRQEAGEGGVFAVAGNRVSVAGANASRRRDTALFRSHYKGDGSDGRAVARLSRTRSGTPGVLVFLRFHGPATCIGAILRQGGRQNRGGYTDVNASAGRAGTSDGRCRF